MSKATIEYRGVKTTVTPGHKAVIDCYKKKMLGQVKVEIEPFEDGGIHPEGTQKITENGTYDVGIYAEAEVDVQPPLDEKTVTPTESEQIITAADGKYGLSAVTVEAIKTQEKIVTENGTVEPDEGMYLKKVTVNAPVIEEPNGTVRITDNGTHDIKNFATADIDVQPALQEKTVTPTEAEQMITPDADHYGLSKVTVDAIETEVASVTANGTVIPSDGKYLKRVDVNVPIPDGYVKPVGAFPMTENGTYDVTRYESAEVNVQPELQSKSTTPTSAEQVITADEGIYGLSSVTVAPVPTEEITVTEPVTEVTASDGKFISKVTVNVPTVTVYSRTTEPTDDIGEDGDIYLLLEE